MVSKIAATKVFWLIRFMDFGIGFSDLHKEEARLKIFRFQS
jgi:hypothetical protein